MASRPLQSPRKRAVRRERRERLLFVAGVGVTGIVGGIITLANLASLRVSAVHIENDTVTEERELRTVIDDTLAERWFFIFPKRNGFLLPKEELRAAIMAAFPRIAEVTIELPNPRSLNLTLAERTPDALWCGAASPLNGERDPEDSSCYFLDATGMVFARSPVFNGTGYFSYYGPLVSARSDGYSLGETTPLGQQFLPEERYRALRDFLKILDDEVLVDDNMRPVSLEVLSDGVDYKIVLEGGMIILISAKNSFADTTANVHSALRSPEVEAALAAGKTLRQIDVRFGNRVYYKISL